MIVSGTNAHHLLKDQTSSSAPKGTRSIGDVGQVSTVPFATPRTPLSTSPLCSMQKALMMNAIRGVEYRSFILPLAGAFASRKHRWMDTISPFSPTLWYAAMALSSMGHSQTDSLVKSLSTSSSVRCTIKKWYSVFQKLRFFLIDTESFEDVVVGWPGDALDTSKAPYRHRPQWVGLCGSFIEVMKKVVESFTEGKGPVDVEAWWPVFEGFDFFLGILSFGESTR